MQAMQLCKGMTELRTESEKQMRKILGIYDTESSYGERLAGYLSAKGRLPFRIVVFTSEEMLLRFAGKEEIHILLIHERLVTEEIARLSLFRLLMLTEESGGHESRVDGQVLVPVYKYQSAERIQGQILECYEAMQPLAPPEESPRPGSGLITIYSPVHHCYKTTFALLYGQLLARSERVLFVSLEVYAGFEELFGLTAGGDLSDALYYDRQGTLAEQLPGILQHMGPLDVLMPVQYPEDLQEVGMEQLLTMIDHVLESEMYTAVVVDAGEALYRPAELLAKSRRIFMPEREDRVSAARVEVFARCMSLWGHEEVWQRMERLHLPCQAGAAGSQYMEQLMWGSMGDYVRSLIGGDGS